MLAALFNTNERLVVSISVGLLTPNDVRRYGLELTAALAEARRTTGRVRHLVLAQDAVVQPLEVMEAFMAIDTHMHEEEDRMAVVVTSVLAKIQAERNLIRPRERAFLEESDARAWLSEDGRTE